MRENFDKAAQFVLKWEGGLVYDPDDPGGMTKYGISKEAHPDVDIINLTREQAKEIYFAEYWIPTGCDKLPYPLDIIAFDSSIQHGIARTKRFIKAVGGDPLGMIFKRIDFYVRIAKGDQLKFLRGWIRRMLDLARFTEVWK